jgi:hypothetical protein
VIEMSEDNQIILFIDRCEYSLTYKGTISEVFKRDIHSFPNWVKIIPDKQLHEKLIKAIEREKQEQLND